MSFSAPMAHFYDLLNDGANYAAERDLVVSHLSRDAARGLDLGCGTGSLLLLLSEDYEMTGVDLSEEMLSAADEKAFSAHRRARFVCQDITQLSLGQKFDFCICFHDTLNYVLKTEGLSRVFSRVFEHLNDDGIFLFDLSRKERFETEYAARSEVLERDGLFCVWEREYHRERGVCDFAFHFFEECADGRYERSSEYERQRVYSPRTVERLCAQSGFDVQRIAENETHLIYLAKKRG